MGLQRLLLVLLVISAGLSMRSSGQDAESDPPPAAAADAPDTVGQSVVIRVGRERTAFGRIELEDDNVIVIRNQLDQVESFSKSKIHQIVRLLSNAKGKKVVVVLRNGDVREGALVEDGFEYVLLDIEGIRAKLPRAAVAYTQLEPTIDERYAAYKATIEPGNEGRHMVLCRWLFEQRQYELCRDELTELLQGKQHPEALRLLALVNAQLRLVQSRSNNQNDGDNNNDAGSNEDKPDRDAALPDDIISTEDVRLMQVFEIDFKNPPRVEVTRDTVRQLILNHTANPLIPTSQAERNRLYRAGDLELVRLMFEVRARELYGEINVITEPKALAQFRRRVHNGWLLQNCATSRCHGGSDSGRFFLHRQRHKDERVAYTNLLILERLELNFQWPLINYDDPQMSLIIQHGLPRDVARLPHPDVAGWRPVFSRANRRMLDSTLDWIGSMMQPRPEYPVQYTPPVLKPVRAKTEKPDDEGRTGR